MEINATRDRQHFDEAHKQNQEISTENQYPTLGSSSIVNETLDEIVTKEKIKQTPQKMKTKMILNRCLLFKKEETSLRLFCKWTEKKLCDNQINFKTRKLRT